MCIIRGFGVIFSHIFVTKNVTITVGKPYFAMCTSISVGYIPRREICESKDFLRMSWDMAE